MTRTSIVRHSKSIQISLCIIATICSFTLSGCNIALQTKHPTSAHPITVNTPIPDPDINLFTQASNNLLPGYEQITFADTDKNLKSTTLRAKNLHTLNIANEVVQDKILRLGHLAQDKAVDITSRLLAVGPDTVGVAYQAKYNNDDRTIFSTVWYDSTREQTYSGSALIEWDKWPQFFTTVVQVAKKQHLDIQKLQNAIQDTAAPYGKAPAYGFNKQGDLLILFSSGTLTQKPLTLTVPCEHSIPFLSILGQYAIQASLSPSQLSNKPTIKNAKFHTAKKTLLSSESPNLQPITDKRPPLSATSLAAPLLKTMGLNTPKPMPAPDPRAPKNTTPSQTPNFPAVLPEHQNLLHPSTAVGVDCIVNKCVAITYDDGPGPYTIKILKTLDNAQVPATFFEIGENIKRRKEVTLALAGAGIEIGNHTIHHPSLPDLTLKEINDEIAGNSKIIQSIIGRKPLLLRPPYGEHDKKVAQVTNNNHLSIIQWSVDTTDWNRKITKQDPNKVLSTATDFPDNSPQPIILMHDVHPWTVEAASKIINALKKRGFTLVTVSEMSLNTGGVQPGHAYCYGTAYEQTASESWCAG